MSTRLKLLSTIGLLSAMLLLLLDSTTFMVAFSRGINTWAVSVLPAILPFMVLGRLLASISTTNSRVAFARLPNGAPTIIALSAIAGYPMGAKLIQNSYTSGNMTTNNCIKTSILASTASPIFIVATIGSSLLGSSYYAIIIIISHLIGGVVNYMIHYNYYNEPSPMACAQNTNTNSDIMVDSLMAVLLVGAYIALFSVLCEMILQLLPSWFAGEGLLLTSYLLGLLEMTTGCINICAVAPAEMATVLCCSLISFGGLCIVMQCMTFYKHCNIKYGTVLKLKCVHCALSTIICYLLVFLL